MGPHNSIAKKLYSYLTSCYVFAYPLLCDKLPDDGIYFFYEESELVNFDVKRLKRVIRVGTHREDHRLKKRIQSHYGNTRDLHGNKNASVFRKHLGGAILRRENSLDNRISFWERQGAPGFQEVEELVSRELRTRFTFSCARCIDRGKRLRYEEGLIALLSHVPFGRPSKKWLGYHAGHECIRTTGLWNTQHVNGTDITDRELDDLMRGAVR